MAHVALVAQQRSVQAFLTAKGMVVRDGKGTAGGMGIHGMEDGAEVVGVEIGVGVKAHHQFAVIVLGHDALKKELPGPSHPFFLACPCKGRAIRLPKPPFGIVS